MATFDVNNFIIDHVLRGLMTDSKGSVMWSINQITDPSLNVTSETAQAVDALGTPIVEFNRGRQAEFTANNSIFDLGLYASQMGVEKEVAASNHKIVAQAFETITVPTLNTDKVNLAHTPKDTPNEIYKLKGDGSLGEKLVYSSSANTGKFTYEGGQITFPTESVPGEEYFITYEYESESAVSVSADSINFPKAGKFVMEVLGTDVCDPSTLIHAYLIFPNAKLDANVDISFTTDGNHPFTIKANPAYCDKKKILFSLVIPEEA